MGGFPTYHRAMIEIRDGTLQDIDILVAGSVECRRMLKQCIDASKRSRRALVFGYLTAVKLYDLPVPRNCGLDAQRVDVCVADQRKRTSCASLRYHYWSAPMPCNDIVVDGEVVGRIVDPVVACMQMSRWVPREELTVLFDALMTRCDVQKHMRYREIHRYLADTGLFAGKTKSRWACAHARMNTDSPMETRLRLTIEQGGIRGFEVNCRITHPNGEVWFGDLVEPELGIILEYQGAGHWTPDQGRRDSRKSLTLQQSNCCVLPITIDDLASETARTELVRGLRALIRRRKRLRDLDQLSFVVSIERLKDLEPEF
ncbi:hypothetical protein Tam10B_1911 [Bifidobacterium vansinderenii]|uniref:DUF559 domain-containing protein n=2 Tax=Bifidobacterium vansinderenii TaxID=1984871 RepID=A0A229VW19_9BIFI|nr:hypothetical protein Tam10B_1911 [Bifidobacterium vansinderenii]